MQVQNNQKHLGKPLNLISSTNVKWPCATCSTSEAGDGFVPDWRALFVVFDFSRLLRSAFDWRALMAFLGSRRVKAFSCLASMLLMKIHVLAGTSKSNSCNDPCG